jgi:1-acyl-sn-glycerol-3-phosphate acyltransferase
MLLLCFAPQPVSFVAKEPLFRMPVVSWFVKAMQSLPAYRKVDQADTSANKRTFEAARKHLLAGGAIGIFPEGTSHSEPHMKEFKTGAARMALGARSLGAPVQVVPVGLFYSNKAIFRSDCQMTFGQPIEVPVVTLDADGEPPRDSALALTEQIRKGLEAVTVHSESHHALDMIRKTEEIFNATRDAEIPERVQTLQRFAEVYPLVRAQKPEQVRSLEDLVERHTALLSDLGLSADHADPRDFTVTQVLGYSLKNAFVLALWAPIALIGWIWHMPAYYLVRVAAFFYGGGNIDQKATAKLFCALLTFPLSWILAGMLVGHHCGWLGGIATILAGPLFGYAALVFKERIERVSLASRGLAVFLTRRRHLLRLAAQRRAIYEQILSLGKFGDTRRNPA